MDPSVPHEQSLLLGRVRRAWPGVGAAARRLAGVLALAMELAKLRVVSLLLLTSLGGAFLASAGRPSASRLALLLVLGTLSAGGASAMNQFLEREPDRAMKRTRRRPLPSGRVSHPEWVLRLALAAVIGASLAALVLSPWLAVFLSAGALIYVGVYTLWLKPRSVLNIVVGGAAGSCAVLAGSAAVGRPFHPAAVALALLVFLWTPAHFWALAMTMQSDYRAAGVPMLPARAPNPTSARWIAVHVAAAVVAALVLAVDPSLGWIYFLPVAAASLAVCILTVRLLRSPSPQRAMRVFLTSNLFLAVVVGAVIAATAGRGTVL